MLIEGMRERGVEEGLVRRCEVIVRETKNKVRMKREIGEEF